MEKKKSSGSYAKRQKALEELHKRQEERVMPEDELADVFESLVFSKQTRRTYERALVCPLAFTFREP